MVAKAEKKKAAPKKAVKKTLGRPKIVFRPWDHWQEEIISLYSEGASDVEIRGLICERMANTKCHFDLWDRWLKEEPIFSETIKRGRTECEIWWQKQARTNLQNREFSAALWFMNMKNRFKWCDKPAASDQEDEATKPVKVIIEVADASRDKV